MRQLPISLRRFSSFFSFRLFLFPSVTLLLGYSFIFSTPITLAYKSTWNRHAFIYPQGHADGMNNWDTQTAAGYCSRTKGRAISFTHTYSFPLSGITVLILVSPAYETNFDYSALRLHLYQGPTLLAGNLTASRAPMIGREGNGSPTFDVFFPVAGTPFFDGAANHKLILECLTDDPSLYRVWESTDLVTGATLYYNSITSQEEPYAAPGVETLFSLFRPRDSTMYPASPPVDSPSPPAPTPPPPPKFHPVVLIHGMGGRPENWADDSHQMNYQKMLLDLGYPKEYIHLYNYGTKDYKYNYQGDVREIAANLEAVVAGLSALHKSQGGDGRVDLVGHSLGTLVARYYLNTHKTNHNVRKFVAVGAPFKGSWIMDLDQGIKDVPGVGTRIESGLAKVVAKGMLKFGLSNPDSTLSPSSAAGQQVISSSSFLKELNDSNSVPNGASTFSIYSDINLSLEQKLFNLVIRKKASVGDAVILPESATYLPGYNATNVSFAESGLARAKILKNVDASFSLEWPTIYSMGLFHTNMLGHDGIKNKIKEILTSN